MMMKKEGFTLLEVLVAFAIFAVMMGLLLVTVTGSFKSLRQAEVIMLKEQKMRLCLFRLNKEISSFTRIVSPQISFKGENQSFFLSTPKRIT